MPWGSLSVLWGGGLFSLFHLQTISFCLYSFFSPFKDQCCFPYLLQQWDPQAQQLSQTLATTSPAGLTEGLHSPCPAATPPSTLWPSAPGPLLLPIGFRQGSSRVGVLHSPDSWVHVLVAKG